MKRRAHWSALSGYTLLTAVLAWPVIRNFSEVVAGDGTDIYINLWANWWTHKAWGENLTLYQTENIFFPEGVSLAFHGFSHLNTCFSLLLTPLLGPLGAYSIPILLTLVLSGFTMYLLSLKLTNCPPAAFIAGLIFAFNPYHISETSHPHLVSTQWIPLFVLSAIYLLRAPGTTGWRHAWLAALWFVLTALSGWHLMTLLIALAGPFVLHQMLRNKVVATTVAVRRLLLFVTIGAATLVPFVRPLLNELRHENASSPFLEESEGMGNDLASFLLPNTKHPVFADLVASSHQRIGYWSRRQGHLGFVPLALAGLGVAVGGRNTRFWLLMAAAFFLLSLGSRATFLGTPLHSFDLPWADAVTGLLRHPFRFSMPLLFVLSILVAHGAQHLYIQLKPKGRVLAGAVLTITATLVLFEYCFYPFPTTRPICPPFHSSLAEEEGDFAVADFPIGGRFSKYYMYYQTIHGHRIVDGHVSRLTRPTYAYVDSNPLLRSLRRGLDLPPDLDVEAELAALASDRIRYVIVHTQFLTVSQLESWKESRPRFPRPYYSDEIMVVYRTGPSMGNDYKG